MIPDAEPLPTLTPDTSLRGRVVLYLVLLMLGTVGAVLGVIVWGAVVSVEQLSRLHIETSADHAKTRLDGFLGPVRDQLETAREWADTVGFEPGETERMSSLFLPVLRARPEISSFLYAEDDAREFMLLRRDDDWLARYTLGDTRPGWARRTTWTDASGFAGGEVEEKDFEYFPRTRQWYEQAVRPPLETPRWTEPYKFFTTQEPGITTSIAWESEGRTYVFGVDVLLRDISLFTTQLDVSTNGGVVVLTRDGDVVGLPRDARYADAQAVKEDVLKPFAQLQGKLPIADAVAAWTQVPAAHAEDPFTFTSGGATWWAGVRRVPLDEDNDLNIFVIVPETDFRKELDAQYYAILAIAGLALVGAVLLALRLNHEMDERVDDAVERAQRLGQYTLTGKIGQGGIGAVYRARHSMLRRPCAVKVLQPQQKDDQVSLARFEREVQATAELSHPNTISIYDYGRTPDGVFYYAMEYLRGITLYQLVKGDGPQPPGRVIHILRQVCASLAEAHERGLVHRDIKPGNIMLCERGRVRDFVKVLDFGLVKSVEQPSGELTQQGALFGTPNYMSPEGVRAPDDVGAASDLFAVGAVGYFLLTGTVPFPGSSLMEVLTKLLKESPERPSERLGKPLPDDLQDTILACLAKRPERRPESARALEARLAACSAAGTWTAADIHAWWDAHAELLEDRAKELEGDELELAVDLRGRRS